MIVKEAEKSTRELCNQTEASQLYVHTGTNGKLFAIELKKGWEREKMIHPESTFILSIWAEYDTSLQRWEQTCKENGDRIVRVFTDVPTIGDHAQGRLLHTFMYRKDTLGDWVGQEGTGREFYPYANIPLIPLTDLLAPRRNS